MGILTRFASIVETAAVTAASATGRAAKRVAIVAKASVDEDYRKGREALLEQAKARVEAATVKASIAKTEKSLDEQLSALEARRKALREAGLLPPAE